MNREGNQNELRQSSKDRGSKWVFVECRRKEGGSEGKAGHSTHIQAHGREISTAKWVVGRHRDEEGRRLERGLRTREGAVKDQS